MTSTPSQPVVLGAGPVGRAVVASLVRRGHHPTVVTRRGTAVDGATSLVADVTDAVQAKSALADATVVFQCAQPPYHRWVEEFPTLQRNVLDGCEASGAAVIAMENLYGYGPVVGPITEEHPLQADTRKGRVRAAMWNELAAAHEAGRVPTAAVRASDFFGPGVLLSSYGERFFGRLVAGRKAEVFGDPTTRHAVTYVPDVGEAMVRVAEEPASWGRAWHVPTAPAVTQRELVRLAAEAAGTKARASALRPWMLRAVGLFHRDARELIELAYEFEEDFLVDSSAFTAHFGMEPTPLTDAIAETVSWYRSEGS